MKYKYPKVKLNSDGNFGPTKNDNYYHPISYHNKNSKKSSKKTRWVLKQNEQYEVFRVSDEAKWSCDKNDGLFSILENGQIVLGENEERLSFFPNPKNEIDAWHGFPITSGEYEPSDKLVDKWYADEIIDQRMHIKILKGQL